MHFAASISVQKSLEDPLQYYENNVSTSINLIKSMLDHKVHKIIFSSTAAVYGNPVKIPIGENCLAAPLNPYGRSKSFVEHILKDTAKATPLEYIIFRYFNACGNHPSGKIGQLNDNTAHLIFKIFQVVNGQCPILPIYGNNYPTPDGTCIRDYIHVMDICQAHLLALRALHSGTKNEVINLGLGKGFSVKEMIRMTENVCGQHIPSKIFNRRQGDPAVSIASRSKAKQLLGWKPTYDLASIIKTTQAWENTRSRLR